MCRPKRHRGAPDYTDRGSSDDESGREHGSSGMADNSSDETDTEWKPGQEDEEDKDELTYMRPHRVPNEVTKTMKETLPYPTYAAKLTEPRHTPIIARAMHNRSEILESTGVYVVVSRNNIPWCEIMRKSVLHGYCVVSYDSNYNSSPTARHVCVLYQSGERVLTLWDGNGSGWDDGLNRCLFSDPISFDADGHTWQAISISSPDLHSLLLNCNISSLFEFGRGKGWCALITFLIVTLIRDAINAPADGRSLPDRIRKLHLDVNSTVDNGNGNLIFSMVVSSLIDLHDKDESLFKSELHRLRSSSAPTSSRSSRSTSLSVLLNGYDSYVRRTSTFAGWYYRAVGFAYSSGGCPVGFAIHAMEADAGMSLINFLLKISIVKNSKNFVIRVRDVFILVCDVCI